MHDDYPPSPVPGDANPWPGELPFTAFGSVGEGMLDLRVFEQDVYWVDIHGRPHLMSQMSQTYLCNVVDFVVENAEVFHIGVTVNAALQMVGDLLLGRPSGHLLSMELGVAFVGQQEPMEWAESTPLMRGLRRRLAQIREDGR